MHLLLAQKGTLTDGEDAVDLGQSTGDIIFLSSADTELASLAVAQRARHQKSTLRLVNLLKLRHPMSVDAYVERTARHAKLMIVRLLGGESYWPYGLEALHTTARENGIHLAVLPGDNKSDPALGRFNTVSPNDAEALWSYLIEGGAENSANFLAYCDHLISGNEKPAVAAPLLKAGVFGNPLEPRSKPVAAIVFYRALVQSGQTKVISDLCAALEEEGLAPLPIFVSSLKDPVSAATVSKLFTERPPDVVLNLTGFAVSSPSGDRKETVLDAGGSVVLQAVLAGTSQDTWQNSAQGLSARDLAMNVALPEVDGRILTRAIAFKSAAVYDEKVEADIVRHEPVADRIAYVVKQAAAWVRLKRKKAAERLVGVVLANYPNRDGRIANGVGLDTPAGTLRVLSAMNEAGYRVDNLPVDGDELVRILQAGVTNATVVDRKIRQTLSVGEYNSFFGSLPEKIRGEIVQRWGWPENDPYFLPEQQTFALPLIRFGNVVVGIQPARGYNVDPKDTYHSPDLVPPHGYFAFYAWMRSSFEADAIIHMGKHGNLEWLPGKALALSQECYPEAILGPIPHLYPFIVNDPGEGTQAKRRTSAVIVDHLTPPLTRAESYGPLRDLEALVDEYYDAAGGDPRRLKLLKGRILDLVRDIGLDHDAGIEGDDGDDTALEKLDAYLCELKEMQIRDGLHIFGEAPEGRLLTDLVVALARVPRGLGEGGDQSLQRAIATDVGLYQNTSSILYGEKDLAESFATLSPHLRVEGRSGRQIFDPLDCEMGKTWAGPQPEILQNVSKDPWRTNGDTVERIELLASGLVSGELECPSDWPATKSVLEVVDKDIRASVTSCGTAEISGLLRGLDGGFVVPGPSGAPTRGRPDVLPTGRNFFSVDSRAIPTPAAWELGEKSAELLITRYMQDHGEWPKSIAMTAWGTSNMRTGGDDIAQALALIGVKPVWEPASRRVTGYEIIPQAILGRPRVDVVMRISGFFRDAFPDQIALFDRAVRAVANLQEDEGDNPIAARYRRDREEFVAKGLDEDQAERRAGFRVFGSKPGAYGAGLQALIDEKGWRDRADLAEAWLVWGSYAYGAGEDGSAQRGVFEQRLGAVEAVVQNQDNREHDLLDSDDYYQFEGGMTATVEHLKGDRPTVYHNDHSRPERPIIRTLEDEIGRVVRARVVNPKWIDGVMRHGYKGAFEIAATVDYLFAFSATTGAVRDHHFEAVYQAFIVDDRVRTFIAEKNPEALKELADRLAEAIDRGLWTARSNSAKFRLEELVI